MNISNLKIAKRPVLGFGIKLTLLATVSVISVTRINAADDIESVTNDPYPKAVLVTTMRDGLVALFLDVAHVVATVQNIAASKPAGPLSN